MGTVNTSHSNAYLYHLSIPPTPILPNNPTTPPPLPPPHMYLHWTHIIIEISNASHAIHHQVALNRSFRLLKAVHNNNICSALITLLNNFLDCRPTEDGDGNFIFIFEFFKRTVERMNERILQVIFPP